MVDKRFAKIAVILIAIAMIFTSIAPIAFAAAGNAEKEDQSNKELTVKYTEESGTGVMSFESDDFTSGTLKLGEKEYDISQTYGEINASKTGSFTSGDEEFNLHAITWEEEDTFFTHKFELVPIQKYKVKYTYSGSESEIKAVMPSDEASYKEGDMATILQPTETEVESGGKTYHFKNWLLNGEKVDGSTVEIGTEDVTFDSEWKADTVLSGETYEYDYDKAESSGTLKPGTEIKILVKGDEEDTITSDGEGRFDKKIEESKEREDKAYPYTIEKNADYLAAEGTLSPDGNNKIYIRERYIPTSSDYKLSEQEGVENGYVKEPGTYKIEGTGGNKLSKTLDGEASDTIEVDIDEDGVIEDFYVYKDGKCSKVLSGENAMFDTSAPVINSVTVSPAKGDTYVKEHGIYSKEKAEIFLDTSITEKGSGLKEVYLIGIKDGKETRYDAVKQQDKDGRYKVIIALPDEETLKDAEVMYLVAVDKFDNVSERKLIAKTEAGSSVTLEIAAPKLSHAISEEPNANGWYKKEPTITAIAKDETAGLESIKIYQDGKLVEEKTFKDKATTEQRLSVKADAEDASKNGSYTFRIEAKDNSGNISEEEFQIKIDLVAPILSIGGAEADGYYSKAPAVTVSEEEKYYSEKGNLINIAIKKEGRKKDKNYKISAKNYFAIPKEEFSEDGVYTVKVTALDAAGNAAETKTLTFTKDGTAPTVTLAPTKKANIYGWYNYRPTLDSSAQDSLSGLVSYTLTEDSRTMASEEYGTKIVTSKQYFTKKAKIPSENESGAYRFIATAVDRAGNKTSKAVTLKVDLTRPVLSASGVTSGAHYRSVPSISVYQDEKHYKANGSWMRYYITLDSKKIIGGKTFKRVNNMTVPGSLFSQDGVYSVGLSAQDAAGNYAKDLKYKFVHDSTNPVVRLSGASEGQFYNRPVTITLEVDERFYDTNKVSTSATRNLNGNVQNVGFPFSSTGQHSSSSKTFSDVGTYTVTASAVDKAGNGSGTKSLSFTVDQVPPEITITGVQDGKVYVYGEEVYPKVEFFDDYLDSKSVTFTKAGKVITDPNFEPIKENDGHYTLTATATDKAGNTTTKIVNFTINRFGSYFVYPNKTKDVMGEAMKNLETDLSIAEHNVSKLEESNLLIYRDGKKIEGKTNTKEKLGDDENVYTHTFSQENFVDEGAYEINVSSKDEAGNEMESKDENGPVKFYVDRTAPSVTLSGIDPKGNKGEEITVNIDASDLLTGVKEVKAYVNGSEVAVTANEEDKTMFFKVGSGMRQEVKVTAEDGAGNIGEATETASVSSSSLSLFLNRFWGLLAGIGAALLALLGILFALFKRKKKEEA